jgi:putative inorganic carbon (hco3(-)) transporter
MQNQPVITEDAPPSGGGTTATPAVQTTGISDSANIRLHVWEGAIKAWQSSPLIGTGVETFAFAYYKHKPAGHNMTSEWDYLYNKAHNEYLNYLTTTGLFGLGSYLAFIGLFFWIVAKYLVHLHKHRESHKHDGTVSPAVTSELLIIALTASFITILITNFFGFSVVIMNIYLFLIPLFVLMLGGLLKEDHALQHKFGQEHESKKQHMSLNGLQWTLITVFVVFAAWQQVDLLTYRQADVAYALGSNLDKTGNFQQAYPQLKQAVETKPGEPVYKDELAINLAAISAGLYSQNDAQNASQLAKEAIALNTDVVTNHPNNVVYWKNRVRLFYTLSATDQANAGQYIMEALKSINKAKELAPTDAKISYNQGILYGQTGDIDRALSILEDTVKLKPDYRDAYVALGLFYHQSSIDENNTVTNPERLQKAISTYEFILEKLNPNDEEVKKSLDEWKQL